MQFQQAGNIESAALCAMLSRQLDPDGHARGFTALVHLELGGRLGLQEYVYAGTDALIKSVTNMLNAKKDSNQAELAYCHTPNS